MTNVDQFESVFKAAVKTPFHYEPVALRKVMTITDFPDSASASHFVEQTRSFLAVLADSAVEWNEVHGNQFDSVRGMLELVEESRPDLICTYRNLDSEAWNWPYSLGEYIDLLTQVTTVPILLLPHPRPEGPVVLGRTKTVMVLTDHLSGDARLVNYAAGLTVDGGKLVFAHIEDEANYNRCIDVIGKIPSLDTDTAREEILKQLLKEPDNYVDSCSEILRANGVNLEIEKEVGLGHHLSNCMHLVEKHKIDLLVINAKDEEQMAMHGLAYPLAIEMRATPLLML